MNMKYVLCAGLVLALSGCTAKGTEATPPEAMLKYDGNGNGVHSETPQCDDQGKVKGSGGVPDGDVTITLKDSSGRQLLQQTFKGDFTLDEKTVSGASGTWNFQAQRSSDDLAGDPFAGHYVFYVDC